MQLFASAQETVRLFHLCTLKALSPIHQGGKLFPSIERYELSINFCRDRGKINVTPELNSRPHTSIKGNCKQYVKSRSVCFLQVQCPGILRSSFCNSERCFSFSSVFSLKTRIMFEVEGEIEGRINSYEANVSPKSQFFFS